VHAPAGRPDNAAHVGRRDQHREDIAQPPHQIVAEFPAIVVFDEAQQAPVPDAPNDHAGVYAITVQLSRAGLGPPELPVVSSVMAWHGMAMTHNAVLENRRGRRPHTPLVGSSFQTAFNVISPLNNALTFSGSSTGFSQ
jgi:hypothetical protein